MSQNGFCIPILLFPLYEANFRDRRSCQTCKIIFCFRRLFLERTARKMSEGRKTPVQQQAQRRPAPAQSSLFQDFFQLGQPAPPPDELPVGRDLQKPFCLLLFVVMFFAGYYAYLIWPPVLYLPSSFSDLPDYYPQSRIVR